MEAKKYISEGKGDSDKQPWYIALSVSMYFIRYPRKRNKKDRMFLWLSLEWKIKQNGEKHNGYTNRTRGS